MACEWIHVVALLVFAYEVGGAAGVGIVTVIRMLPPAFAVPFAALAADRYPRQRILVLVHLARALGMALTAAVLFLDAPPATVYVIVSLSALASVIFRPAQWALMPSLVELPEELVAVNVVYAMIEGIGTLVGPLVAGFLLAVADIEVPFVTAACVSLWAALLTSWIKASIPPTTPDQGVRLSGGAALAGFRTVVTDGRSRLLVGLFGAQTLVRGVLSVLVVVAALDLLAMGEAGVGWLNAALGAGGLVGGIGAFSLAGRQRLAAPFGAGLALWGAPIVFVGVWPEPTVALGLLAVVGAGNTLVDVAGLTLFQRTVADNVLCRVLGVLEALALATIGVGGLIAPVMVTQLGVRGSLMLTGLFLPALTVLSWKGLNGIDAYAVVAQSRVMLLRTIPMFAPLSSLLLERMASSLKPVKIEAGEEIFRQGDIGDTFYVISDGEVEIAVDGKTARRLRAGDHFGEIALLRGVPRTGTATTTSESTLLALEGHDFVSAVTGYPESAQAADAVIGARLSHLAPRVV